MIVISHTQGVNQADGEAFVQRSVFDTESYAPWETLVVESRYLNTPPKPFKVTSMVVAFADDVDGAELAAAPVVLDLKTRAGVSLLTSPLVCDALTNSFPATVLLATTLPALAQIHTNITEIPTGYMIVAPLGMRVMFIGSWLD